MSNFTNLNEIFHIFSKTPVADGQTLASARNKSGHTVTTSDVWAEDIPAFFSAPTQTYKDNLKTIAKDNDLCYDETNKSILYFKNGNWVQRNALKDGELLANYEASKSGIFNDGSLNDESKAVVKYYKDRDAIAIDGDNNNTADGNRYTARIAKDNNSFVQQFVSSMDKIVNGNPSSYYEPVVNGGDITEDIKDKGSTTKYIANNYSGIIQFHKQMVKTEGKLMEETSDGTLKPITISAFEYIGKTLTDVLKEFETVGSLEDVGISYKIYIPTKELPLPDLSIEDNVKEYKNTILLVPEVQKYQDYVPPSAISGGYVEWLCVNNGTDEAPSWAWEQIGTTEADLTDYVKVIEVNGKVLTNNTDGGDNQSYLELGSFAETVASGQASTLANKGSVYANIATNGTLTLGVASATNSVMGVSKMFTGELSTAASTVTDTAVSVKSAQAMYSSLASAIASDTPYDEFDIPTFDLNYILQSKINEPWVEEMVITSSDYALQIPHKETHYGTGDSYFKYDSIKTNGFYTLSKPISLEEYNSGIKYRPIATINKTKDGEYDLTSIYNFPETPYTGLTAIEYENLKCKIKKAFDEILKGQVKLIEDAFKNVGFSYKEEDNPYNENNTCQNSESGITDYFNKKISPFIPMYINISPYKDKLNAIDENYKNFIIKITTPTKDDFSINEVELTIVNSASSNIILSDVAENALKEYIYEESPKYSSKYSSTEDGVNKWVEFLSKTGREAAYKAKWIYDAKNDIIKTPLAFQYQIKTTYDLFRLILINLLGEEQYGEENSLSKKYMKPGITFTCLTRPYDRIGDTVSQYYSYTQNRWKGNPTGKYHDEVFYKDGDIKWDYIPSMYTLNNTATWGAEDSFAHPTHWDTTTNEQKFDCLVDEVMRIKDDIVDSSSNITISENQASTLANQKSVYGHIAEDDVLSLGVVSANDNTMGVSKLFTGTLSTATSNADDTAVSLKSIQAMYNTLASLIAGLNTYVQKVTTLETQIDYLYKGYYDVSRANRNTAPDGTHWNHIVHNAENLKVNYIMYDDIDNLGMMYGTVEK